MKIVTAQQQRRLVWSVLKAVVPVVAIGVALQVLGSVSPAVTALLVAAGGAALALRVGRWDRAQTAGPTSRQVTLADSAIAVSTAIALLMAPGAGAGLVAPVSGLILAIGGWAATRLISEGSRVALLPSAWLAAFRASRLVTLAVALVGLAVSAGLTVVGAPAAALIGAGVAIGPARRYLATTRLHGRLRRSVERTLAGVMTGGAWSTVMEQAQRAPVRSLTVDAGVPGEIRLPIPERMAADRQEVVEADVVDRLSEWGLYAAAFTTGGEGGRGVVVRKTTPLPTALRYDGRAAIDGTRVWIGRGRGTREHGASTGTPGLINGESFDFCWDLRIEPHGIAVGQAGSGKSQTVQLVMMQLALAGWSLVLIDPKRVEFSQWVGRPGVVRVTTELEDHVEALEMARAEMERRYVALTAAGVNHIDLLPHAARPRRLLVVVDEVVELLAPTKAKSDEAKEQNEMKARASVAIGSLLRLGRAAGCHLILAGQRADRSIVDGEYQNNLAFKILQGKSATIEKTMIGLSDVTATPGVAGRAVAASLRHPQTEVQVAYVDLQQDLDKYLPRGGVILPGSVDVDEDDLIPPVPVPGHTINESAVMATPDEHDVLVPALTLDDLGGYETVKAELLAVVGAAFTDAAAAAEYGVQTGGVLLYGPPGTGKTHISEALAGSLGVRYLPVSVGDLTGRYLGDGAALIRAAVDAAILATPAILMIDEIDAVAGRRDGAATSEGRAGVNEVLVQLDRARRTPGVVVMATTNDPERLDPAVIRDGRMSAKIRIDLPDLAARVAILTTVLAARPTDDVDVSDVAARTAGYTAAALTGLVDGAARAAMGDGQRSITTGDLLTAMRARGGQDRPTVEGAGLASLVLAGNTEADLREVLALLGDPDRAKRYGIKAPSGLLLTGPPGTGKTSIARALAAEARTSFYAVAPGGWSSKWQGESERQVRELFERARANAPSIVFIDEIDAIAKTRGGEDLSGSDRILTALLAEMDGFGSDAAGGATVFVVAATNRPDVLDPALTRPGRLSRTVEVGLPDHQGRLALLGRLTAGMPLDADVDLSNLATITGGQSPADLMGLCQQAAMVAMRSRRAGAETVGTADFLEAIGAPGVTDGADWLAAVGAD